MGQLDAAIRRVWREPHPLAFLASRLFWKTGLCRMFVIRRGTYRLHFFPTSYSANLWTDPESEQAKNNFYKAYLRTRDTVVDVGANIGFTTFNAAVLVPDDMVLAFEPHPVIFRYLSANHSAEWLLQCQAVQRWSRSSRVRRPHDRPASR